MKNKLDLGPDSGLATLTLPANTTHYLDDSNSFVHLDAIVAGFGFDKVQTNYDKITYQEDLKVTGSSSGKLTKLKVKTISKKDCEKGIRRPITDTRMCAMIAESEEGVPRGFCYVSRYQEIFYLLSYFVSVCVKHLNLMRVYVVIELILL